MWVRVGEIKIVFIYRVLIIFIKTAEEIEIVVVECIKEIHSVKEATSVLVVPVGLVNKVKSVLVKFVKYQGQVGKLAEFMKEVDTGICCYNHHLYIFIDVQVISTTEYPYKHEESTM